MYYHNRNLENIEKLADYTKAKAKQFYQYCVNNGIEILIYETIRTEAKQREYVRKGKSQTMRSYHRVGQALDFVPCRGAETLWNGYGAPAVQDAVRYAKSIGFEWGGDWKGFVDSPHLQYNYKGYGTDTWGKGVASSSSDMVKVTVDVARVRTEPTTNSAINTAAGENGRIYRDQEFKKYVTHTGLDGYTWIGIGANMWVRGDLVS